MERTQSRAQRFSREEACRLTGATRDELAEFERSRLLVPTRRRQIFWSEREPAYSASQIEVLRWLVKTRRKRQQAWTATRPSDSAAEYVSILTQSLDRVQSGQSDPE